ncbi:MAG: LiaI-LiaF-like domain-containing protein [Sphingobacteriaceae bacterium]
MKTEKMVWGITLVFIGTIFLLDNFGLIDFYWRSAGHFWPLILILIGLNLVFGRSKNSRTGALTMVLITCLILSFIAFVGISHHANRADGWAWFDDQNGDEEEVDTLTDAPTFFSESYNPAIAKAELHIEGGGTEYTLGDSTQKLFEAEVDRSFGRYNLSKISRDSVEVLNFKMNGKKKHWNFDKMDGNSAVLRLNPHPIWDIELAMGAGKANFDLSAYKVAQLQLKGGAAAFDVKLGLPLQQTNVKVETGMAKIELAVPQQAACIIRVESGLSSKDFEGFTKQSDGSYTTPNFTASKSKIIINLKGGLSDFEVSRY